MAHYQASPLYFFQKGLLTNLSNPKTAIFITSLFATVFPGDISLAGSMLSITVMLAISFVWYFLVAALFSLKLWRQKGGVLKGMIDKISGAIFLAFGIKILLGADHAA